VREGPSDRKPMMLLEPLRVGSLSLKNRMVRSPMLMGIGGADGEVTDRLIDHYGEAAKGGVSMVIMEFMAIECGDFTCLLTDGYFTLDSRDMGGEEMGLRNDRLRELGSGFVWVPARLMQASEGGVTVS